jgi:hypothetical protein
MYSTFRKVHLILSKKINSLKENTMSKIQIAKASVSALALAFLMLPAANATGRVTGCGQAHGWDGDKLYQYSTEDNGTQHMDPVSSCGQGHEDPAPAPIPPVGMPNPVEPGVKIDNGFYPVANPTVTANPVATANSGSQANGGSVTDNSHNEGGRGEGGAGGSVKDSLNGNLSGNHLEGGAGGMGGAGGTGGLGLGLGIGGGADVKIGPVSVKDSGNANVDLKNVGNSHATANQGQNQQAYGGTGGEAEIKNSGNSTNHLSNGNQIELGGAKGGDSISGSGSTSGSSTEVKNSGNVKGGEVKSESVSGSNTSTQANTTGGAVTGPTGTSGVTFAPVTNSNTRIGSDLPSLAPLPSMTALTTGSSQGSYSNAACLVQSSYGVAATTSSFGGGLQLAGIGIQAAASSQSFSDVQNRRQELDLRSNALNVVSSWSGGTGEQRSLASEFLMAGVVDGASASKLTSAVKAAPLNLCPKAAGNVVEVKTSAPVMPAVKAPASARGSY